MTTHHPMDHVILFSTLSLILTSCMTTPNGEFATQKHETSVDWYDGPVEDAFAFANRENRLVFLYWGADWCPPCNELKDMIFSRTDANESLKPFVRVYLDGDDENAQMWGDRLKIGGYPTMMVLLPNQSEIIRLTSVVEMPDFKKAMQGALQARRSIQETMRLAISGRAKAADWQTLAYYDWIDPASESFRGNETLRIQKQLADLCPSHFLREKALLSASLLEAAARPVEQDSELTRRIRFTVRSELDKYLQLILSEREAILVSRNLLLYQLESVLTWGFDHPSARRPWAKKWLAAVDQISNENSLSFDDRLWTIYPHLQWYRLENPGKPQPRHLIDRLHRSVKSVDQLARKTFERTAVISGASFLLADAGDLAAARKLLLTELKTSSHPWYLSSSLASLEERAGNEVEALRWSTKSRLQAKGRASKLQWSVSDLLRQLRLDTHRQEVDLFAALNDVYDTLFSLADGFKGRNATRLLEIGQKLQVAKSNDRLRIILEQRRSQCGSFSSKDDTRACTGHFASILGT